MTMQRRHFELIASTIKGASTVPAEHRATMAEEFADALARTNSNFDRDRFLRACGCAC